MDKTRTSRAAVGPSARVIAATVLERVERDRAFAAAALDAELSRHPQLDERDRALSTELVYGCLRNRSALLAELTRHAPRGLGKDRLVLAHLMVAAYQLLALDRVPAFAAVNEAVDALRRARGQKISGFANAVLRKVAGSGAKLPDGSANVPVWLLERLIAAVGADEARALLHGEAPIAVRIPRATLEPEWLLGAERGKVAPTAKLVRGEGDLRQRAGYAEGQFVVQEEGAQAIAWALGARRGERVLDACAGRGQKTTLLRECVGAEGEVWAVDLYPAKLEALQRELQRLRMPPVSTAAVDWSVGSGEVPTGFDRVLVDAPCTGVGTLRRRPEIALRLAATDVARLSELQLSILRRAAGHVRSGGRLVYAVCSVLPDEGESVVEGALDLLEPVPFDAPELAHVLDPDLTALRLLPRKHGTDGYFVASFRRR
jgi:16S rRNA (cytosine967-C5)-methyltransferase